MAARWTDHSLTSAKMALAQVKAACAASFRSAGDFASSPNTIIAASPINLLMTLQWALWRCDDPAAEFCDERAERLLQHLQRLAGEVADIGEQHSDLLATAMAQFIDTAVCQSTGDLFRHVSREIGPPARFVDGLRQ